MPVDGNGSSRLNLRPLFSSSDVADGVTTWFVLPNWFEMMNGAKNGTNPSSLPVELPPVTCAVPDSFSSMLLLIDSNG